MSESIPIRLDDRPPISGFPKFRETKLSPKVSQYADIALRYLPLVPVLVTPSSPPVAEFLEAHDAEIALLERLLELVTKVKRITVTVETTDAASTFVFGE